MRLLLGLVLAVALASPSLAAADKFRGFKLKTLDGVEKTLPDVLGKATLVVFFFPTCPYCNAAKSLLQEKGVTYEEVNAEDPEVRAQMVERAHGRRTVPQIFIGDTHVGGYDDMAALDRRGQLDPLLAS